MELLTYNQAYEAQVVGLWNQELYADPITVHKFRQQALLDDNLDRKSTRLNSSHRL